MTGGKRLSSVARCAARGERVGHESWGQSRPRSRDNGARAGTPLASISHFSRDFTPQSYTISLSQ